MAEEVKDRYKELQASVNPARNPGESYADYRERRSAVNKIIKARLRGAGYFYQLKYTKAPGSDIEKGIPYVKEQA